MSFSALMLWTTPAVLTVGCLEDYFERGQSINIFLGNLSPVLGKLLISIFDKKK